MNKNAHKFFLHTKKKQQLYEENEVIFSTECQVAKRTRKKRIYDC